MSQDWVVPEDLDDRVAAVTEGFSFAYLKEMWVSALMAMVGAGKDGWPDVDKETEAAATDNIPWASLGSGGSKEQGDKFKPGDLLWKTIEAQVATLRKEMRDIKMSVEDPERNTSTSDAKAGDARYGAGVGLG